MEYLGIMYLQNNMNKSIDVEVTASVTLSGTFKISVDDYKNVDYINEDGLHISYKDFSDCDLKKALEEQHWTPQNMKYFIKKIKEHMLNTAPKNLQIDTLIAENDTDIWNIDDYQVILEE